MPHHDEFFDVYYDIGESLFDHIRSMMDRFYNAKPRTPDDLAALKTIHDHVVRAVAAMESVTPESIYRDLEETRSGEPKMIPNSRSRRFSRSFPKKSMPLTASLPT